MARRPTHSNRPKYSPGKAMRPEVERRVVAEVRAAQQELNGGRCPNDRQQLDDGACKECRFRIRVAEPIRIEPRVEFYRQWSPRPGVRR